MTLRAVVSLLLKRWWLIVLVPAIALPAMILRVSTQPYQTSFNAIVLLPGDTEIPGNSERPELMVMDDVPGLIASEVFAQAVATELAAGGASLTVDDVHGALSGVRYSRILTVTSTSTRKGDAEAMAGAAAHVLADQVNTYLVADQSVPATVQIIDAPGEASRSRPNQSIKLAVLTLLAVAVGAGLALLAHSWSSPLQKQAD